MQAGRRTRSSAALGIIAGLLAWWIANGATSRAEIRLHPLFSDGAVLQQGLPLPVFGTGTNGERVTIRIQGKEASTTVADGQWQVTLPPLESGGPFTMEVVGTVTTTVTNLLVGEVWLCSGQSNMAWPVIQSTNPTEAINSEANPFIRLFTVPAQSAVLPNREMRASWNTCGFGTVSMFSAVGFYFGRDLQLNLKVPIGLINASAGGSTVESWMSRSALEAIPEASKLLAPEHRATGAAVPGVLFDNMIKPLTPFAIRGVIFYQGESNVGRGYQYRLLFPALIAEWRKVFERPDMPFLFVQLAPYRGIVSVPSESAIAEVRESQFLTMKSVPNTAMVVTMDLGDHRSITPRDKAPVGARLALAARALAYGQEVEYSGPVYESMERLSDRIVLNFSHIGGGLQSKPEGEPLKGFTIAADDRIFRPAEARIEGDKVVVSSKEVITPRAVRYGWADYPVGNLWNKAGLPASPFRTDDYPLISGPKPE